MGQACQAADRAHATRAAGVDAANLFAPELAGREARQSVSVPVPNESRPSRPHEAGCNCFTFALLLLLPLAYRTVGACLANRSRRPAGLQACYALCAVARRCCAPHCRCSLAHRCAPTHFAASKPRAVAASTNTPRCVAQLSGQTCAALGRSGSSGPRCRLPREHNNAVARTRSRALASSLRKRSSQRHRHALRRPSLISCTHALVPLAR